MEKELGVCVQYLQRKPKKSNCLALIWSLESQASKSSYEDIQLSESADSIIHEISIDKVKKQGRRRSQLQVKEFLHIPQ